jgi:hypothetical protein
LGTLLDAPHLEIFVTRHGEKTAGKAWRVKLCSTVPRRKEESDWKSEGGSAFGLDCGFLMPPHGTKCHPSMNETVAVSSAIDPHDSRAVDHRAGFETTEWHR